MAKKAKKVGRRAAAAKVRAAIIPEIVRLERRYGEAAVSGAFSRRQQIRRERRKLERTRREIDEKIARLAR